MLEDKVYIRGMFYLSLYLQLIRKNQNIFLSGKIFSLLCWDFFVFVAYLFLFPNLDPLILSSKYSTAAMFFKSH